MFIDCDDTVHDDIVECIMSEAMKNDRDMVMCAHNLSKEKDGKIFCVNPQIYPKYNLLGYKDGDYIWNFAGLPWCKVYKREMFENIVAGNITEEVKEMAAACITAMDAANEKRKEKNAQKADAYQVFINKLAEFATNEAKTASDFKEMFVAAGLQRPDEKEMNVQFVSSIARKAVAQGLLTAVDVKIPKKGVQKGYVRA